MTKQIPNSITILNLLCGVMAVFFAINGRAETAAYLIFAAALFDFFDGFAARALKAYSEIGRELDSLADLISFGMAPAAILSNIMYGLKAHATGQLFFDMGVRDQIITLSPFILVAFSALRLAKFNTDTRQSEVFLGLTTTATGIFTASFALLIKSGAAWAMSLLSPIFLIVLVSVFCALLISEIPMFSLKFKSIEWKGNEDRFVFLALGLALIAFLGLGGISLLIVFYVLFSVVVELIVWARSI
ncbi:MAG: CDP-alcohol phosphatidyltransferase family protein [Breznakibacter sp.]